MTKQSSFNKAKEKAVKSAAFKGAVEKLDALNIAAELEKRGINITNTGFAK